jgi:hypothetical protein
MKAIGIIPMQRSPIGSPGGNLNLRRLRDVEVRPYSKKKKPVGRFGPNVCDDCEHDTCISIRKIVAENAAYVGSSGEGSHEDFSEGDFLNDKEKMRDFAKLTKEDFMFTYSYLTEAEYDNTARLAGVTMADVSVSRTLTVEQAEEAAREILRPVEGAPMGVYDAFREYTNHAFSDEIDEVMDGGIMQFARDTWDIDPSATGWADEEVNGERVMVFYAGAGQEVGRVTQGQELVIPYDGDEHFPLVDKSRFFLVVDIDDAKTAGWQAFDPMEGEMLDEISQAIADVGTDQQVLDIYLADGSELQLDDSEYNWLASRAEPEERTDADTAALVREIVKRRNNPHTGRPYNSHMGRLALQHQMFREEYQADLKKLLLDSGNQYELQPWGVKGMDAKMKVLQEHGFTSLEEAAEAQAKVTVDRMIAEFSGDNRAKRIGEGYGDPVKGAMSRNAALKSAARKIGITKAADWEALWAGGAEASASDSERTYNHLNWFTTGTIPPGDKEREAF